MVRLSASSERRDVYDLMVADAHEFTAAGIIVHNCVWAVTELTGNFGADAWLKWAKRKAEQAAADRGEGPAPEPGAAPPGEKPEWTATAAGLVAPGPSPGTWRARSGDGQRDYVIGADGRCPCDAGMHDRQCRHVDAVRLAGGQLPGPADPAERLRQARNAAFRAQSGRDPRRLNPLPFPIRSLRWIHEVMASE